MSRYKTFLVAGVATVALAAASTTPANAFWRGGHWGGGALAAAGIGAAAGLTLGALTAAPAYAGYGYYGAPYYSGYYGSPYYSAYGYAPSYAGYYDYDYAPTYSTYSYAPGYDGYDYAPGYSYGYGYSTPRYSYRSAPSRGYVTTYQNGTARDGYSQSYRGRSASLAYGDRQYVTGYSGRARANLRASLDYNQRSSRSVALTSRQQVVGNAGQRMTSPKPQQLNGSSANTRQHLNPVNDK